MAPFAALPGVDAPRTVGEALARISDLRPVMEDRLDAIAADPEDAIARGWLIPAAQVELHSPVGQREMIVCVGGNYAAHAAEFGAAPPPAPPSFVKSASAVIGPGEAIVLPAAAPDHVDYEGEICVVFGRTCHAVGAEDAMCYVAGYTLLNDVSARDKLAATLNNDGDGPQWAIVEMLMGKQFPTFAPLGPEVVTADEIADPARIHLKTTVNGTVMQDSSTADLIVDIPGLIAAMSQYYLFRPGDLLSTGSPAGVGAGQDPPVFLRPGDVVSVSADCIGALTNTVRAAA
ncbi:fumarylacetoacetate hydrolase family protein [Mycobacterium sp. 3519A]|uniref:fumarylacetoacetate hydrolase family protein n=1 Tax=Mycobacterium sp. 3519A TaxID=2057184 RepID=UPI00135B12B5|nr:fumarylacetoacetate hydrolase family protein [Mycobacterium sp. 3519A]